MASKQNETNQTTTTTTAAVSMRPYFDVENEQVPPIDAVDDLDEIYIDDGLVDNNNNPEDVNPNADFDEKDELLNVPLDENIMRKKSIDTVASRPSFVVPNYGPSRTTDLSVYRTPASGSLSSDYNLPDGLKRSATFDYLDKSDFDERNIGQISDVFCMCDANRGLQYSKESGARPRLLPGRLVLTNYRLQFLPYECENMNDVFSVDPSLQLFNSKSSKWAICIPLTFIYDIRATSSTSDKIKKVKYVMESSNGVIRDIIIKCKNFMTKQFTFEERESRNYDEIYKFINELMKSCKNQQIIQKRFNHLFAKRNLRWSSLSSYRPDGVDAAEKKRELAGLMGISELSKRKTYLLQSDLESDLVDSKCELFMKVGGDRIEVIPSRFVICSNMPFCVVPKQLDVLVKRERVVINEANVIEFGADAQLNAYSSASMPPQAEKTKKPHHRLGHFINPSSSSRLSKSSSKSSSSQMQTFVQQDPILAQRSQSNPFVDNRFPMWSYTDPHSMCSIVVVPESLPNRQDECDIILKNYNCFLIDKTAPLTKPPSSNKDSLKQIGSKSYCDYEFVKLEVPFSSEKIATSYQRLLDLCSFRSQLEFYKENETFYSRLQNTKWLRNVSTLLSLTQKMINAIAFKNHNVFLEERHPTAADCSCILTSLAKICLSSKYRSIIGLEDLIQKEWFLAGHLFNKRLHTSPNFVQQHNDDNPASSSGVNGATMGSDEAQLTANSQSASGDGSVSTSDAMAPTFLLFLDCLFQLLLQFPNEFEYTETYLIWLWDLSLSGLSFTYSFNGVSEWLNHLKSLTHPGDSTSSNSLKSNISDLDPTLLHDLFAANNEFWVGQYEANKSFLRNQRFEPSSNYLVPCEKIYMLKFWSRCYLRWIEKYHAYTSNDTPSQVTPARIPSGKEGTSVVTVSPPSEIIRPTRPPPLPPKPIQIQAALTSLSSSSIDPVAPTSHSELNPSSGNTTGENEVNKTQAGKSIEILRTSDGILKSSF